MTDSEATYPDTLGQALAACSTDKKLASIIPVELANTEVYEPDIIYWAEFIFANAE